GYTTWSGTSASAAIIAGSAALMRAVDSSLSNGVIVGRLARNADPAGAQDQTGNGRVNLARSLTDTSTDQIEPAGAAPVGNGGPFVGPYRLAARGFSIHFSGTGSGSVSISVDSGNIINLGACAGTGGGTAAITINGTCTSLTSTPSNSAKLTLTATPDNLS